MTKDKTCSYSERYLITPSLLNSWGWIFNCVDGVTSNESDKISLEDKIQDGQKKAKKEFIKALRREPLEPNEYMLAGIQFEKDCYDGKTCVSPIIKGGSYQIVGKKNVSIGGMNFLMYGKLDVLKGGVIYDIKRVWKYSRPKYNKSYQHGFYLELFERAKKFKYLIFDGNNLHIEQYYPDECEKMEVVIKLFIEWLDSEGLLELYKKCWKCRW